MSAVATRLPPGLFALAIVGAAVVGLLGGTHALVSHSMSQGLAVAGQHVEAPATGGATPEVWAEPQPAQQAADGAHSLVLNALVHSAGELVYAAGAQRGPHHYGTDGYADAGTDYYDAVLIAYEQAGEARWVRTAGGASEGSSFRSVSTGRDGMVYAGGWSRGDGPVDLGGGVTLEPTTSGTTAILIAYDSDGLVRWAASPRWEEWDPWGWLLRRLPGKRSEAERAARSAFQSVAVDWAGNVYAAGAQSGTDVYHYGEEVARATARGANALLVKYDSAGNARWARTVGSGAGSSTFLSVAVDDGGYVYAAGYQDGTDALSYGTGAIGRGDSDRTNAVLVKYAPDGTAEWVRTATGSGSASRFVSVAVDSEGNVYVAGSHTGTESSTYGAGVRIAGSSSKENPVLVSFASDGSTRWARTSAGSAWSASFRRVTVGQNEMVYVAGSQYGTGELNYGDGVLVTGVSRLGNPVLVGYTRDGIARWAAIGTADQYGPAFGAVAAYGQEGVLAVAVQPHTVCDNTLAEGGARAGGEITAYSSKVLRIHRSRKYLTTRVIKHDRSHRSGGRVRPLRHGSNR